MVSADFLGATIRAITVPAAVCAALYYLVRRFPVRKLPELSQEELATRVSIGWSFFVNILAVVFMVGLCFAIVYGSQFLNAMWAERQGPSTFLLLPTKAWWYLYGGFFGLSAAWPLAAFIAQRYMDKTTWLIWINQQSQRAGFDCDRAMRWLAYLIIVPYTALFLPSLVCHTRFSETEIATQGYSDWKETKHPYSQVTRFAVVHGWLNRKGEFDSDPRVVIDFSDGKRWTTRDGFRDPQPVNSGLVNFLIQRTGLQPLDVRTEHDLK